MSFLGKVNAFADQMLPDSRTEKLTFRRFKGEYLAEAAKSGKPLNKNGVVSVSLKVNPTEISWSDQKITSKVPTNRTGRFVVFDWGNDLSMLNITGSTGNLMPDVVRTGIDLHMGPVGDTWDNIAGTASLVSGDSDIKKGSDAAKSKFSKTMNEANGLFKQLMYAGLSYHDLLDLSPKYRSFRKLQEEIYDVFDADTDVLVLEMGPEIYRGHFNDFRFSIVGETPWNWKYTISFVSMENITKFTQKGEEGYNSGSVENS